VWLEQLGNVQLDLEVVEYDHNGTALTEVRTFSCSPLHATLISHFEDQDQWSPNDLSNETGVLVDVIKKKMSYWINHRVVRTVRSESSEGELVYELAASDDDSVIGDEEEEDEGGGGHVSLGAQENEAMEVFESYIFGMLTNMGQLPLERIHNMLKTFVTGSDHRYDKNPQQLSVFLQQMCKEEKLECGPDGMYKLVKKN
jgi:anaphase-promoting complex subunit 2